jgi:hypothetical protein
MSSQFPVDAPDLNSAEIAIGGPVIARRLGGAVMRPALAANLASVSERSTAHPNILVLLISTAAPVGEEPTASFGTPTSDGPCRLTRRGAARRNGRGRAPAQRLPTGRLRLEPALLVGGEDATAAPRQARPLSRASSAGRTDGRRLYRPQPTCQHSGRPSTDSRAAGTRRRGLQTETLPQRNRSRCRALPCAGALARPTPAQAVAEATTLEEIIDGKRQRRSADDQHLPRYVQTARGQRASSTSRPAVRRAGRHRTHGSANVQHPRPGRSQVDIDVPSGVDHRDGTLTSLPFPERFYFDRNRSRSSRPQGTFVARTRRRRRSSTRTVPNSESSTVVELGAACPAGEGTGIVHIPSAIPYCAAYRQRCDQYHDAIIKTARHPGEVDNNSYRLILWQPSDFPRSPISRPRFRRNRRSFSPEPR